MTVADAAAARIAELTGQHHDVAVVLGSGWSPAARALGSADHEFAVTDLPGFPPMAVAGHTGTIRSIAIGDSRVVVFLGRSHLYEGRGVDAVVHPVRTAVANGCRVVILTNACGATRTELAVGQPVLISDHLNLTATSPLVGPQFIDLTDLYSPRLRQLARDIDPTLPEGVYAQWRGPAYETPAEIRMIRLLGADLVGMSTVPEAIAARALGAEVLAIGLVTNPAAGVTERRPQHTEVLAAGHAAAARMGGLLREVIARM
jgi:purine-nucleoside phosphorylase